MNTKKTVLTVIAILIVLTGVNVLYSYWYWNSTWGTVDSRIQMEIASDESAERIESRLIENGILDEGTCYWILADLRGITGDIRGGEYVFTGDQTRYDVLDTIAKGNLYRHEIVIKGGMTQFDVAEMIDRIGVCTEQEFFNAMQEFAMFEFVVVTPPNDANPAIEGMLMPATYYSVRDNEPRRMAMRISRKFNEIWNQLIEETEEIEDLWWKDPEVAQPRQVHNVIVLASIVEKEAKNEGDKPQIAAVLVNRLKQDLPLEAKSTIHFAIQDWERNLTRDDFDVDSPYNTFKNKGLPPSALCNPNPASIKAALNPPDLDNISYQYTEDGTLQLGS